MCHDIPGAVLGPFNIGGVLVDPPVVLAPMAAVTNRAFRLVCKQVGGVGLLCTEQISTNALRYRSARTLGMLEWTPDEQPLSVQLFGSEPGPMAAAAREAAGRGAAIIDLNMGCWVPKVCRQGAGAALLRDRDAACRVVEALVGATDVPVTVKMRAGYTAQDLVAIPLARRFVDIGVKAITLHGRTAEQGFEGSADWQWIAEMREELSVPVIGNGDVRSGADAVRMARATGCAGIMVGRAAIGNPWILGEVADALAGRLPAPRPPLAERVEMAIRHATLLAEDEGEGRAVVHLRAQVPHYVRGLHGASRVRERMMHATSIAEVRTILLDVDEGPAPAGADPSE